MKTSDLFGKERIDKLLLRLSPPVILAQAVQAVYSLVDSMYIGRYSATGLTAMSVIYPLQMLMIALALGSGMGLNTVISAKLGIGKKEEAEECAGMAAPLAFCIWLIFALATFLMLPVFAGIFTDSELVIENAVTYGRIQFVGSLGYFLEYFWMNVRQANGDMKTPMIAQVTGVVINIILDPLLIFGWLFFPEMGVAGAATATITGYAISALILMRKSFRRPPRWEVFSHNIGRVFRLGSPRVLMNVASAAYIFGLNLILSTFSDQAVTVLGLYFKWQSFFYIPFGAMIICIVPIISFNYAAGNIDRCRKTVFYAVITSLIPMAAGAVCYILIPGQMLSVFTSDPLVISIGSAAFPVLAPALLLVVVALIFAIFFQSVGQSLKSSLLSMLRMIVLFVPLGYLFSRFGLEWFWLTFAATDIITASVGYTLYRRFLSREYMKDVHRIEEEEGETLKAELAASMPGVIITITRQHGSSGKQAGKLVAKELGIPFYYKEMIALAAHESGLDREFISNIHRNSPGFMRGLYLSSHVVQRAVVAQSKIINRIADAGSCVIVGRAADYVLRDRSDLVRVFVQAPEDIRISRIMEIYGDSHSEAKRKMRHSDKARAAYYRHICGKRWGDPANYDLVVDSSAGAEDAARQIIEFVSGGRFS